MKTLNVVSYGAGVDSTAMILKMVEEQIPIDIVIFADTGGELPETYKTLQNMEKYLKKLDIPLITVRNFSLKTLFEKCIMRKVFPDTFRRWCTRDFKVAPIHRYYRKHLGEFHINEYLGIDAAETKRMRVAKEDYITKHYPLVDWDMNRLDCELFIAAKKFPTVIKSGCYFCPFNSKSRWDYIRKNHPRLYRLCKKLERNSKHYPKLKLVYASSRTDDFCGNGFS